MPGGPAVAIVVGHRTSVVVDDSNCIVIEFANPTTRFTVVDVDHLCFALRTAKTMQAVNDELCTAERERKAHGQG